MTLTFRNLRVSPDAPVSCWPTEAVRTALERGDLDHWRALVAEVRRDPWGKVARQLEEVLAQARSYGIGDAMDVVISRERERADRRERDDVAAEVRAAIARSGLSRAAFASRIGTSRTRLSTYATGSVTPSAALMVRMRRVASEAGPKVEPFGPYPAQTAQVGVRRTRRGRG